MADDTCVNCGAPDPKVVGTTNKTLFEIGRLHVCWMTARSHYCDVECIAEYGNPEGGDDE